jgi:hypothetical protein
MQKVVGSNPTIPTKIREMSRLLNKDEIGNLDQKKIREETIKKWSELGFLEGHKNEESIDKLYENEDKYLLDEASKESTGSFDDVVFPIIRRCINKMDDMNKKEE